MNLSKIELINLILQYNDNNSEQALFFIEVECGIKFEIKYFGSDEYGSRYKLTYNDSESKRSFIDNDGKGITCIYYNNPKSVLMSLFELFSIIDLENIEMKLYNYIEYINTKKQSISKVCKNINLMDTLEKQIANPNSSSGICPHCGVYTEWKWEKIAAYHFHYDMHTYHHGYISPCYVCNEYVVYYKNKIIYPKIDLLIKPNIIFDNYPKSKKLFMEAVEVSPISPRAGLTLSRMCLEALVNDILAKHNKNSDKDFNKNIDKLFELDIITQRIKDLLSSARIIGNKSIHNFNIIDTENDPIVDDCILILEFINSVLEHIRTTSEESKELSILEKKIKGEKIDNIEDEECPF